MTPEKKIEYVKGKINDKALISPIGPVFIKLYTVTEDEDGPIIISAGEQRTILKKLEEDGYIKNLSFNETTNGAWLELSAPHKTERNIKNIEGKKNTFSFNLDTGDFRLNKTEGNFTLNGQEYSFIKKLTVSDNNQVGYEDLIKGIWKDRDASSSNKHDLQLLLKKIKTNMGILPTKKAKNPDIFKNIKNFGYRIVVK